MGMKLSCCMGDCNGNKNVKQDNQGSPTRWQDIVNTATPEKSSIFRTRDMEISLELLEIENQIDALIANDNPNEENTKELKRLIEFKELKTKELNNCNATSECLWK